MNSNGERASSDGRMIRLTKPRTTNFYYSFLFLPPEKRRAIEAVYAFARRGDDLADSGLDPEDARLRLDRYRATLDRCYDGSKRGEHDRAGRSSSAEVALTEYTLAEAALAEAIRRFRIPRRPFDDLILGFEMDLEGARYCTFDDLSVYCYRVASVIGLIAIEVFGYSNPETRQYAVNLGVALQLVNILRDVHRDALAGRVYLPEEDLASFGVSPGDLSVGDLSDPVARLMRFECSRAREYFQLARQSLPAEDRRSMLAAEIMGATYWELLRRIERRGYDVFRERIRLSRARKLWIALQVYWGREWCRGKAKAE